MIKIIKNIIILLTVILCCSCTTRKFKKYNSITVEEVYLTFESPYICDSAYIEKKWEETIQNSK